MNEATYERLWATYRVWRRSGFVAKTISEGLYGAEIARKTGLGIKFSMAPHLKREKDGVSMEVYDDRVVVTWRPRDCIDR